MHSGMVTGLQVQVKVMRYSSKTRVVGFAGEGKSDAALEQDACCWFAGARQGGAILEQASCLLLMGTAQFAGAQVLRYSSKTRVAGFAGEGKSDAVLGQDACC